MGEGELRRERFHVNGREALLALAPGETLLAVLRRGGYTEVKCGCQEGKCGACLVLLDGKPVNSCQVLAMSVRGRPIVTAAGLGTLFAPSELQRAFVDAGAVQCGFCTPGFIVAAHALLEENRDPSEEQVRRALDGNLCRCTGYVKIVEAVRLAARRQAGRRE
jgi:aerobic-type carbon monoxide dehydrogenase small subunit (CoxS/CutS family)